MKLYRKSSLILGIFLIASPEVFAKWNRNDNDSSHSGIQRSTSTFAEQKRQLLAKDQRRKAINTRATRVPANSTLHRTYSPIAAKQNPRDRLLKGTRFTPINSAAPTQIRRPVVPVLMRKPVAPVQARKASVPVQAQKPILPVQKK